MIDRTIDRCRSRGRALAAMVAAACVVPMACGEPKDASLCTAFAEFQDARTKVAATDPETTSAEEATEAVEDYLASVRRLEQAADGRYGAQLDALETAVNEGLLTLESVQDDADFSTWGPLVEDDREMAADAAVQVENAIAPSCTPEASETSET